jgi:hypothetical protein
MTDISTCAGAGATAIVRFDEASGRRRMAMPHSS